MRIVAHRVALPIRGEHDCVHLTAGSFLDFVRDPGHVEGCTLILEISEAQLASIVSAAHKKPANIVDEARVIIAGGDGFDIGFDILVKVYDGRRHVDRDLLALSCATLAI